MLNNLNEAPQICSSQGRHFHGVQHEGRGGLGVHIGGNGIPTYAASTRIHAVKPGMVSLHWAGRRTVWTELQETIQACQTCFGCRLALVLPVTHVPPTVSQSQIRLRKALSRCPLTLNSQPTNCQTGGGRRGWGREASP